MIVENCTFVYGPEHQRDEALRRVQELEAENARLRARIADLEAAPEDAELSYAEAVLRLR